MTLNTQTPRRVILVDDEPELHDITGLVCSRMKYKEHPIELLCAHSAAEAMKLLDINEDIAVALVDMNIENNHVGLDLICNIRIRFPQHKNMRIILLTGNPGMAPQHEILQHYDIDDYREKKEFTEDRLFTTVYTAIRAYETLTTLHKTVSGLEHILSPEEDPSEQSNSLDSMRVLHNRLTHIVNIMDADQNLQNGFITERTSREFTLIQAWGSYVTFEGLPLAHLETEEEIINVISNTLGNTFQINAKGLVLSIKSHTDCDHILWMKTDTSLKANTQHILNLYVQRFLLNIDNSKLQNELLDAHQTALNKLCEAIEMRSKETGQHIYRMAKYSKLLAQLCGLQPREINLIEATAPLHDIGKIATHDAILSKPGKLTDIEMEQMRMHAQQGHDMLADSKSEMLRLGALVALTHHERWDGSGYPNGLAGEDIPLAGRIVSLADVFDALMSRRSYKEPFSFEETMSIIAENSGKHFDPKLVDLLKKNGKKFQKIFIDNPDLPLKIFAAQIA